MFNNFFPKFLYIFKTERLFTSFLILYSCGLVFIGDNTFILAYNHFIWFLECFVIPAFILLFFKDIFYRKPINEIVVVVGSVAALITLFLILNPTINQYIRESVIDDPLGTSFSLKDVTFRGFTISEGSTYSYGIIQGLILSVCLFSLKRNILYGLPVIFLLISILFNARIGITVVAISLLFLLLFKRIKIKHIIIFAGLFFISSWLLQYSSFAEKNEDSIKWALSLFSDSQSFISEKNNESGINILFNDMVFLPPTVEGIFLGIGKNVYGTGVVSSDIGYIIQIFKGGVIYVLIMLSFLIVLYKKGVKYSPDKLLFTVFIITILVANVKGDAFFRSNGFFRFVIFYYVYNIFVFYKIIPSTISKPIINPEFPIEAQSISKLSKV